MDGIFEPNKGRVWAEKTAEKHGKVLCEFWMWVWLKGRKENKVGDNLVAYLKELAQEKSGYVATALGRISRNLLSGRLAGREEEEISHSIILLKREANKLNPPEHKAGCCWMEDTM